MVRIGAILFFISLLSGQLVRIPVSKGVTVYPHDIALILLLVAWLLFQKKDWKSIWNLPLTKPLLVFLGVCAASLFVGLGRYPVAEVLSGGGYLVRLILYACLYVTSATSLSSRFWIQGLYSVGIGFCAMGIVQFFLYPDLRNLMYLGWDPHYWRLFSTLLDPNFMGIMAVLTFILGFAVFPLQHCHRDSPAGGVAISKILKRLLVPQSGLAMTVFSLPFFLQVLVFLTICLTFSRSAFVAGVTTGILFVIMKRQWKFLILGILICLIVWFVPKPGGGSSELFRGETALTRLENWNYSKDIIFRSPMSGYGFNMLRSVQTPNWSTVDGELSHATSGVDSSLLFVLTTTGIVGLAAFVFFLYNMGSMGVGMMKKGETSRFGFIYILSVVAVFIDSFFINSFFYPWVILWVFVLSGAGKSVVTYDLRPKN